MLGWIARGVLLVAGAVTSWVIAKDAVYFRTAQIAAALLLFVLVVLVAALWPARWTEKVQHLLKR